MEVNTNLNVDAAQRMLVRPPTKPRAPAGAQDSTSFNGTVALEQAVQAIPAVRTEAVTRAKDLIGDVMYPPTATIKSIATLLALNLDASQAA